MNIPASPVSPGNPGTSGVPTTLLRSITALSGLRESELAVLARVATRKSCARGSLISTVGSPSDAVHILIYGRVKTFLKAGDGREMVLRVLGPGELIVEMDVLDDGPSSANIIALGTCEFIRIAREDFKRCLAANSGMVMLVMRELERRLRDAESLIASLSRLNVVGRVLRVLRQAAEVVNGRMVVRMKLSHKDIASRVGSSREAVTQALKQLRLQGHVEVCNGSIIIRDDVLVPRR
jgi:CRP/FNR family cyclic AMP-dependent transcriptional regulator